MLGIRTGENTENKKLKSVDKTSSDVKIKIPQCHMNTHPSSDGARSRKTFYYGRSTTKWSSVQLLRRSFKFTVFQVLLFPLIP